MGAHTILIVDDEEPIRKAIRRILKFEPYQVLDTGDPNEALELVKNHPVHLVVSDHLMPGMVGMDLLRKIRLIKPEVMRIILTGHADLDMAMQAVNDGAIYRFLTKPWDNNDLLVAIRLALRSWEMEDQNRRMLRLLKKHWKVLCQLEKEQRGITGLKRRADGSIVVDDDELAAALSELGGDEGELSKDTIPSGGER